MFRRFGGRTPDSRTGKKTSKGNSSSPRDPPTLNSNSNETSSRNEERETPTTTMRRSHYSRSFDHRSAVSSSGHTTTTTNEDRERLRNFLKGAMATSHQNTTSHAPADQKQALMERVLKRSKTTMDKKVPPVAAAEPTSIPASSSASSLASSSTTTMQSKSNFSTERRALTNNHHTTRTVPSPVVTAPLASSSLGRRLDRVDGNPTAVEFRNRLRKVTAPRPDESPVAVEQTSLRTAHNTTSLLDVKTREMIQHRFRQRHVAPPKIATTQEIVPSTEPQEEKYEEDPDLEGYDAFFQTLQNEVHGQHSLLWASFSAVMKNERPPELEAVPPTKGYRFDKRTKEMLTMMNAYMQEKPYVVHVPATQLVNDKKFSKEWKKQHQMELVEEKGMPLGSYQQPKSVPEPIVVEEPKKERPIDLAPTVSSSSSSSVSPRDRYNIASIKNQSASPPSTTAAVTQSMDFESSSNPGVEVTLGQFELKADTSKLPPRTPTSDVSSGAPLWTNVQLRSVRPTSTTTDTSRNSKTPNFAKVQLRKVSPPQVKQPSLPTLDTTIHNDTEEANQGSTVMESTVDEDSGTVEVQYHEPVAPVAVKPPPVPRPQRNFASQADNNTELSQKEPEVKKQQPEKKKIDEAVYVNLKPGPNDNEGEQHKVIVGRKNIMIVKAKAGDKQADVLWKLSRSDAASLTIDMTQLLVKVVDFDGSILREMSFDNSGDCLKFANTFYEKVAAEQQPTKAVIEKPKTEIPKAVVDAADDDGDTEFAAVRLERLNDEEQEVLDTYRRLRRSKPPKAALAESVAKETATTTTGSKSLSPEEETVASKYRRMLKMRIPVEAVQHSMEKDKIADHVMEAVLADVRGVPKDVETDALPSSPVSTFSSSVSLSESDSLIVERYKKMLKMGIPVDGVRHKLMKEGVDAKLQELILEGTAGSEAGNKKSTQGLLNPADEAVAAHYRKLISRGVPKDSVRHGMAKDNIAPHIAAAVLGETSEPDHSLSGRSSLPKKNTDLTPEEEKIAAEFKKLLKRQIPRHAILDRMKKEGVSEKVAVAVLGKRGLSVTTKDDSSQTKGNSSQFVQIHWTPLSGSQLDNSVWNATKNRSVEVAAHEGTAFSKLKELFEKKTNTTIAKDKSSKKENEGPSKAKLLDINRSNNVAISLKAFKDYSYQELSDIIKFLDPLRKLHGDRIHFLRDLLPTVSETNLVQAFDGPESRLEPAEIWFKSIVGIKRIEAKVNVLRTMELLETESRTIGENLRLLTKVCNQVMDSERLQDLLVMVLQIGNIMNEGTRTGRAAGFKLDSLLKLTQTKSGDGKTTVLDYLVEDVFIAKGQRHKLDLTSDFPECSKAGRMLIGDLVAEVKAMQDSVSQCKEELEFLKKESTKGGVTSAVAKIESQDKNSIHGAIERLENFLDAAEDIVKNLSKDKDEALISARELAMYCGEGSGTGSATSLLKILSEFASSIESAVRKSDEKRKARERREKRQREDAQSTKSIESKTHPEGNGESLVLLVNKMLKDANPRTIEDFRKGRVLHNPSDLMKTIYNKEQTRDVRPNDRNRASLATAIQEKVEDMDEGEFLTARTKFGSPRANMMAKKTAEAEVTTSTSVRTTNSRTPPVPWMPPGHREVGSPLSSAVATDHCDEMGSLVTDTSVATTICTDEQVENFPQPAVRRPVSRPTPEGMPLRDKHTSSNSEEGIKDDGPKRFLNNKPTHEGASKEKMSQAKPTPETSLRRLSKIGFSENSESEIEDTAKAGKTAADIHANTKQAYIRLTTRETQSDGISKQVSTGTLSENKTPLVKEDPGVKEHSSSQPSTPIKEEEPTESVFQRVASKGNEEKPSQRTGSVSALAAAFSKQGSVPIQPSQPLFPRKPSSLSKINDVKSNESFLSVNKTGESSATEALAAVPLLDSSSTSPQDAPKETRSDASAATNEDSDEAKAGLDAKSITQQDTDETLALASANYESTFQYIRDRLDGKKTTPPKSESRPDPPSEPIIEPENITSRPDPPTPLEGSKALPPAEQPGHFNNAAKSQTNDDEPTLKKNEMLHAGDSTRSSIPAAVPTPSPSFGEEPIIASPSGCDAIDHGSSKSTISDTEQGNTHHKEEIPQDTIFDISAARGRLATRKSVEHSRPSALSPDVPVDRNDSRSSIGRKSLQELAALKREKRSSGKSPMKQPLQHNAELASSEKLPSLTGYLEMARQRKIAESSPTQTHPLRQSVSTLSTQTSERRNSVGGASTERESSFSKLAREKRLSRKGR